MSGYSGQLSLKKVHTKFLDTMPPKDRSILKEEEEEDILSLYRQTQNWVKR